MSNVKHAYPVFHIGNIKIIVTDTFAIVFDKESMKGMSQDNELILHVDPSLVVRNMGYADKLVVNNWLADFKRKNNIEE